MLFVFERPSRRRKLAPDRPLRKAALVASPLSVLLSLLLAELHLQSAATALLARAGPHKHDLSGADVTLFSRSEHARSRRAVRADLQVDHTRLSTHAAAAER